MIKRLAGQEVLDGFAVESYEGRVSGAFDVSPETGRLLAFGDEVLLVIQATVKPPTFKVDSNGDLKRIEVFVANEAEVIIDNATWGEIEKITGVLGTSGQTRLFNPGKDPQPVVDFETGEIPLIEEEATWTVEVDEEDEIRLASEHAAARERARVAAADSIDMDDEPYSPGGSDVQRIDSRPAGSQDPILRRFLMDEGSRGR